MLFSGAPDRVTIERSAPNTGAQKDSPRRLTVRRLMVIIAVIALVFGAALQLRSWFWQWAAAVAQGHYRDAAEMWEETEQNEERWASRFLLGAHLARLSGEMDDALILEEASLACLRRSRCSRELAAFWRIAEQEGPEVVFRPSAAGRSNPNSYKDDGVFAFIFVLPILRKYDARIPEQYEPLPPAFDELPGDR